MSPQYLIWFLGGGINLSRYSFLMFQSHFDHGNFFFFLLGNITGVVSKSSRHCLYSTIVSPLDAILDNRDGHAWCVYIEQSCLEWKIASYGKRFCVVVFGFLWITLIEVWFDGRASKVLLETANLATTDLWAVSKKKKKKLGICFKRLITHIKTAKYAFQRSKRWNKIIR